MDNKVRSVIPIAKWLSLKGYSAIEYKCIHSSGVLHLTLIKNLKQNITSRKISANLRVVGYL